MPVGMDLGQCQWIWTWAASGYGPGPVPLRMDLGLIGEILELMRFTCKLTSSTPVINNNVHVC